jgi:hypothetical protein
MRPSGSPALHGADGGPVDLSSRASPSDEVLAVTNNPRAEQGRQWRSEQLPKLGLQERPTIFKLLGGDGSRLEQTL